MSDIVMHAGIFIVVTIAVTLSYMLAIYSSLFSAWFSLYSQSAISRSGPHLYIIQILSVDFSYCWINLVEAWYSLEQYIGL